MAQKRRDYFFTHHLRERFVQRGKKKYNHLQYCRDPTCEQCSQLKEDIRAVITENRRDIDCELAKCINEADENRSYVNNSGFMGWYYDKYGYDKNFEFLIHDDLLFVVVVDKGKKIVVTCVPAKTHLAGKSELRPKFKGKGNRNKEE